MASKLGLYTNDSTKHRALVQRHLRRSCSARRTHAAQVKTPSRDI